MKKDISKNSLNKIYACLFLVVLVIISIFVASLGAIPHDNTENKENKNSVIELGVGQVYDYPLTSKIKHLKSESSDIASATKDGKITGVAVGETTVKYGFKKTKVVVNPAPEKIYFDYSSLKLGSGEECVNKLNILNDVKVSNMIFESSNEDVVTMDYSGNVVAKNPGSAKLTVTTYNGLVASCDVVVKNAPQSIAFSENPIYVYEGALVNYKADFLNDSASNKIDVASSDTNVAYIDKNNQLRAGSQGSANITVTAYNGVSGTFTVNVVKKPHYIRQNLDPNKPMVAFTFDDGPNAATTNRVLKVLKDTNSSATFFLVGSRLAPKNNANAVKAMASMGCQIGNHTYTHERYGKNVTEKDISECTKAIYNLIGEVPTAFRPTGGAMSDLISKNANAPIIIWSLDTMDWKSRNANKVYDAIMNNIKDGDIVLMHDIYESSATAAEWVIPKLVENGFQVVNVAELAYYKGYELQNGNVYYHFR